jgi:hypothetical protein
LTHDVGLNECLSVHGALTWEQQGYVSTHNTPAVADTFTYPGPVAAQTAYQNLLTAMAGCQAHSRTLQSQAHIPTDAVVGQTAQNPDGTAWVRQWTGVEGISDAGAQINHIYLVYRGASLTAVQVTEFPGRSSGGAVDTNSDGTVLASFAARLGS